MNKQEFIDEYDRLVQEYTEQGSFEKLKKLRDELGNKYNSYKRESDGITQEEFIKNRLEEKKKQLLETIIK